MTTLNLLWSVFLSKVTGLMQANFKAKNELPKGFSKDFCRKKVI